jgi:hypothetical protein
MKCSAGAGIFIRKAEPESLWQSVQWQMLSASGSTSASKVISPQWQYPSIFMGVSRVPKPSASRCVSMIIIGTAFSVSALGTPPYTTGTGLRSWPGA